MARQSKKEEHEQKCMTLQEVADTLNMPMRRIQFYEQSGLRKLRRILKKRGIKPEDFLS